MTPVYPVIHHLNCATSVAQAALARDAGADGVFLISHNGKNSELAMTAYRIKDVLPGLKIGMNFLGWDNVTAFDLAADAGADMLWLDAPGIAGHGLGPEVITFVARVLARRDAERPEIFASVAFKYQPDEPDPVQAARNARMLDFIPTTSGPGTGQPPTVGKIRAMYAPGRPLAVASGMTVENVTEFVPYLSHILVATGVSEDENHFDFEKLSVFIQKVRVASSPICK